MNYHPGVNEIEWLAELKPLAELVGAEVFGRPIIWRVETGLRKERKRPDVVVEFDGSGEVVLTGEAKRPDDPHGVTPLDNQEVENAVWKAQQKGAALCFTTNFHQIAVLDAGPGLADRPLERLQGNLIDWISRDAADASDWWRALSTEAKVGVADTGLRRLFERVRLVRAGEAPPLSVDDTVVEFIWRLTQQLVEPLWRLFLVAPQRTQAAFRERALASGLDIESEQDCRYLVSQGVFEVLSAAMFHRLLHEHFDPLKPLLRGTKPTRASVLAETVSESLAAAERESGDYESILRLSNIGDWVLRSAPATTVRHWRSLLVFAERLDLERVSGDILGSIFERLISPERRREMGQHYTQPRLARSMAAWGVRGSSDLVLDPTCGAGTFLVEAYARLRALGNSHDHALSHIFGNDLDSFAVHLAAISLATRQIHFGENHPLVRWGDALELREGTRMLSVGRPERSLVKVDLVIANPPYARSHAHEEVALGHMHQLLGGASGMPSTTGVNLSVWFVLLGAGLLKPDGRMAFVLPSSVLQNENLEDWRRWIRAKWDLVIWHTEDDVWFSDARVATCVVLFSPRSHREGPMGQVQFVNVMDVASGELVSVNRVPAPAESSETRDLSATTVGGDLLVAGTKPSVLQEFEALATVTTLREAGAEVGAGQKAGHPFFKLTDQSPDSNATIRHVTGLATSVRLHKKYLTPVLLTPKELDSGQPELRQNWFLTLPKELPKADGVQEYVRFGKTHGVDLSPSVSARGSSWWSMLPKNWDIAVPMSGQFRHQVALLRPAGAVSNNFNAVRCRSEEDALIIGASLASAFGALSRLYHSGEVGCEGVRRVLLSQFEQWPVLDPAKVDQPSVKAAVLSAYAEWRPFAGSEIDEMPRNEESAWYKLTLAVAAAAVRKSARDAVVVGIAKNAIAEAVTTVARRRRRETAAVQGRTRGTGSAGSNLQTRVRRWLAAENKVSELVELLTGGEQEYALRAESELGVLSFFGSENPLNSYPDLEKSLVLSLGSGFVASWPTVPQQLQRFSTIARASESLFVAAEQVLLGERPSLPGASLDTWMEMAAEVRQAVRRTLQSRVRSALS